LRDQQELQRTEKARLLLEARLKSALDPGEGAGGTMAENMLGAVQSKPGLAETGAEPVNQNHNALLAQEPGFNKNDKNLLFANASSGNGVPSSQVRSVTAPEYKILQGKVIEAITLPRAISDLPGMICALTQRDVYAERGRAILIPWGSRLCGVYNAQLGKGQNRLFAIWNTLRVAQLDGTVSEIQLDSIGSDQLGTAGMGGLVDTHFAEIFGISALLSIFGAGAANLGPSGPDQNLSAAQYRLSVQQAAAQTAQSVLAPYVAIAPTVTVPAGSRIRIFVNRDLDFSSLYQNRVTPEQSGFGG
jgi:type IV secretion system protein VirB10